MRKKQIYELDVYGNVIADYYESATMVAKNYGMNPSGVIRIYTNIRKKIEKDMLGVEEFKISTGLTKHIFIEKDFYSENEYEIKQMFIENLQKKALIKACEKHSKKVVKKRKKRKSKERDVLLINIDENRIEKRIKSENPISDMAKLLKVNPRTVRNRIERGTIFDEKYKLDCNFIKKVFMYKQGK